MKIKSPILILFATCMIEIIAPSPILAQSPDDILVVANKNVNVNTISVDELAALFLKQRHTWKDGIKAVPIHSTDPKLKAMFLKLVLGRTISEERMYWQEQKIKHGASPPPEFSNMLKAVFKLKGAVSYIYRSQYKENVSRILLELPQR